MTEQEVFSGFSGMNFLERAPDFKLLPLENRQMKVINRLNDSLFKYMFGRDENKQIL